MTVDMAEALIGVAEIRAEQSLKSKIICWFSCGITSAVACKIAVDKYGADKCLLIYIEIDSAHEDNERFIKECEQWIGVSIIRRRSAKYTDQYDVIKKTKYVNGVGGARCTKELKKDVRASIEKEFMYEGQVFGFEYDKKEINRAIRFAQQYPHTKPIYPLIDRKLTKEQCAWLLWDNKIELPEMYKLGFHNNNCVGCVKGGMGYWNKIREHFPDKYKEMSILEREVGRSCIKGKFLDELGKNEGRHEPPILPDCGTFCEIEFADLMDKKTERVINGEITIDEAVR